METAASSVSLWLVLIAATATAIATGLGAVPFAVDWRIDRHRVALGTAVAAGLMLAACGMLLAETTDEPVWRTAAGFAVGAAGVWGTHRWLERLGDVHVYELRGADARKALLIMGVMTAHSAAEGVGVGVSFVETERLGLTMATVIAIHNIPEGLAIALVLVPRGVGWIAAAFWAVVSSLPQPMLAVPAYIATSTAEALLPAGLGFAAGAMAWLALFDMIPEAADDLSRRSLIPAVAAGIGLMAVVTLVG